MNYDVKNGTALWFNLFLSRHELLPMYTKFHGRTYVVSSIMFVIITQKHLHYKY
jgi:hypothetical protein